MSIEESHQRPRRLYKSRRDRMIDGVCGGVAEYFNIDATVVRILFILLIFFGFAGLILYISGMILMPLNPDQLAQLRSGELRPVKHNSTRIWGVILIAFGLLFLIQNFGWFSFVNIWHISWGVILPIILILVGMALIYSHRHARPPQSQSNEGQEMSAQQQNAPMKKLYKSRRDRKLFGVCGGLGDYFNLDSTIIRILFILLTILSVGTGIILYIAMAIFVPDEQV